MKSLLALLCLLVGESLFIYAEMRLAKTSELIMFPLVAVAGFLALGGYWFGIRAFGNIWIVSALSVGTVAAAEPVMAVLVFNQKPTPLMVLGLILGVLGMVCALW